MRSGCCSRLPCGGRARGRRLVPVALGRGTERAGADTQGLGDGLRVAATAPHGALRGRRRRDPAALGAQPDGACDLPCIGSGVLLTPTLSLTTASRHHSRPRMPSLRPSCTDISCSLLFCTSCVIGQRRTDACLPRWPMPAPPGAAGLRLCFLCRMPAMLTSVALLGPSPCQAAGPRAAAPAARPREAASASRLRGRCRTTSAGRELSARPLRLNRPGVAAQVRALNAPADWPAEARRLERECGAQARPR